MLKAATSALLLLTVVPSAVGQSSNSTIWSDAAQSLRERSLAPLSDGGFVYMGRLAPAFDRVAVYCYAPDGQIRWQFTPPTAIATINQESLVAHPNGDVTGAGWLGPGSPFASGALGSSDGVIFRLDSEGQLLYAKRFGGSESEIVWWMEPDGAGGSYVGGTTLSSSFVQSSTPLSQRVAFIARIDAAGDVRWVSRGGLNNSVESDPVRGALTSSGGIAFRAGVNFFQSEVIGELDASGQLLRLDVAPSMTSEPGFEMLADGSAVYSDNYGAQIVKTLPGSATTDWQLGFGNSQISDVTISPAGEIVLSFFGPTFPARPYSGSILWLSPQGQELDRVFLADSSCASLAPFEIEFNGFGELLAVGQRFDCLQSSTLGDYLSRHRLVDLPSTVECQGVINSTGAPAELRLAGSLFETENALTLSVNGMAPGSFALFLTSRSTGLVVGPGGSQGNLCLSGAVGRFSQPGQVRLGNDYGTAALAVDLTAVPTPSALIAANAGETWAFQAWYRDAVGGTQTSNFSSAVSTVIQ